jgi:hypothetical protein
MSNNIYLDIDVSNNTNSNKVLSFQEKRNNPIIKAPADDYNLSVVRFNLSTNLSKNFVCLLHVKNFLSEISVI